MKPKMAESQFRCPPIPEVPAPGANDNEVGAFIIELDNTATECKRELETVIPSALKAQGVTIVEGL